MSSGSGAIMVPICPLLCLKDLIAFKSVSGQPNSDIASYIEQHLLGFGFKTYQIESKDPPKRVNLLAQIGPEKPGGLMLSGHMDVVPVTGQNWSFDPFTLTEIDDRLIGRGTADMKGFIAACISAVSSFDFAKIQKPLTLFFTYDEEVGCLGSQHGAPLLRNFLSHLPQAAIIGEPTDFSILRMHSGHVTLKLAVKGKGAHSSNPDLGASAIKALHQALGRIFSLEESFKKEIYLPEYFERPFVLLNVGQIAGGTAVNIVPDEAYATIGFRPLPGMVVNDIVERIKNEATQALKDPRISASIEVQKISPALLTKQGSSLESTLSSVARPSNKSAAQYSTDGGNLAQVGIECLIFGPGSIDVAHKANESINKADLYLARDKIITILNHWLHVDSI